MTCFDTLGDIVNAFYASYSASHDTVIRLHFTYDEHDENIPILNDDNLTMYLKKPLLLL